MKLMDGVRQSKKHPETFQVPSRTAKVGVAVGDYVKLGFLNPDLINGRMWVMITKIEGRKYFGILHNQPVSFKPTVIKYGDAVQFESRHILDIIKRS